MVSYLSTRSVLGGFERYDSLREELLVLNTHVVFCWFLFFVGIDFSQKKSSAHSIFATAIAKHSPTPSPP